MTDIMTSANRQSGPAHLFSPLQLRGLVIRNRVAVSPMCQYSSTDGLATDWHLVHLGSRAVGGAGLVMTEATAVSPEGRISPQDLGIWSDQHVEPLARIVQFIRGQGTASGIQIAHAGRKASTKRPWEGGAPLTAAEGGWTPVGPGPLPFSEGYSAPRELDEQRIKAVIRQFQEAARRAIAAGFDLIEIHAAHGYLLHSFLSPLTNQRKDRYGGSLSNRMRLLLEVVGAIRAVIPERMPLFVRISASDWTPGGWDIEQAIELAPELGGAGVDLVDCSSGGAVPHVKITVEPGYQVPFAERIRKEAKIATAAVGVITDSEQAEAIIQSGQADLIMMGRALLRRPYWPLHAARSLGQEIDWPVQYLRARD